ncbi:hypothetical protein [Rhodoluna lacicola]|uniref:Transcriptional regulator n=1 Tax=Rhodoluna lacicola TaxID=529884 RepID=A0A060JDV5_9MICO|nr:hypothetical protein [Rhodoluna lacicola]AIC46950.1 hypothetical protein Rhola_00001200 [Rhodoluna lacicola]
MNSEASKNISPLERDEEIFTRVAEKIRAAIPKDFNVQMSALIQPLLKDRNLDAILEIKIPNIPPVEFATEVKRILNRPQMLAALDQLSRITNDNYNKLVAAKYIPEPIQNELKDRGVSFADATGNVSINLQNPLMVINSRGATTDPWKGPGRPTQSLKGVPAGQIVRTLCDYGSPIKIQKLIIESGASRGSAYRMIDFLTANKFATKQVGSQVSVNDCKQLLLAWSKEVDVFGSGVTKSYINPRGLNELQSKLAEIDSRKYVLTGSLAAEKYYAYADPFTAMIYTTNIDELALELGFLETNKGANVILSSPNTPVVFDRTSIYKGMNIAAPSQIAVDLLGGPGRNPEEGKTLLDWMEANENVWRIKPDN